MKIFQDSGKDWIKNSTFGPLRTANQNYTSDSLNIDSRIGLNFYNKARAFYGFGHFTYKNNFHGFLYSRIVTHANFFERYSGIERDISRLGFTSGETDQSGICYENNWFIVQFGRGRESWGAGNDIQLGLSENSNSYDYGLLDLDFGKLRVRYFNGYLETDSLFVNRYITGRGIEWNNEKNFLLGFSEVVIYSGRNRVLDFSYLNPISTHLEIELNNKHNDLGTDNGNGVWQISMDYLFISNLKISFNYLFDEFVLDKVQRNANKDSEGGYSFKLIHSGNYFSENNLSNIYTSFIVVGTNSFRHEDGYNNFVNRGRPLGWRHGSDGREFKIGFKNFNTRKKIFVGSAVGRRDMGMNSLVDNPYFGYTNYLSNEFPSGNFQKIHFFHLEIQWWYKPYISFMLKIEHNIFEQKSNLGELKTGLDIFFPLKTRL